MARDVQRLSATKATAKEQELSAEIAGDMRYRVVKEEEEKEEDKEHVACDDDEEG